MGIIRGGNLMSKEMLFLIDVYTDWCKKQKLPRLSADDLLYGADTKGKLNMMQVKWLESFIDIWDIINQTT